MKRSSRTHLPAGFSLIELMIVVAVVAILASIAYPSYQRYVLKSHRNAVQAEMTEITQAFERCRTRANGYNQCNVTETWDDALSESGRYQFSVTAERGTYTIQAVPQATGNQNNDVCGTLTVNHLGLRTTSAQDQTVADCWG